MPKLICHRANIFGAQPKRENNPLYIIEAINAGFEVEVDVRLENGHLYLGHDQADYLVDLDFLKQKEIWVHCKNLEALNFLLGEDIHCFYHQQDEATLTSNKFIWLYPGKRPVTKKSVVVLPEQADYSDQELLRAYAICTDRVDYYQKKLNL